MPALYFFRRDNDNDDNNGQKAPSANDDDYHSYKQISVIVLKKISGGPLNPLHIHFHIHFISTEVKVAYTHSKVRAIYDESSIPVCCARDSL